MSDATALRILTTRIRSLDGSTRMTLERLLDSPDAAHRAQTLRAAPWLLAVDGLIPWTTAEDWAQADRISRDANGPRLAAAIVEGLGRAIVTDGHLAIAESELCSRVASVLARPTLDAEGLRPVLDVLLERKTIVRYGTTIALRWAADLEARIASRLRALTSLRPPRAQALAAVTADVLDAVSLDIAQRQAITRALDTRLTVIAGPAGVGKSAVLTALVQLLERCGESVIVGSPTGKGADVLRHRGLHQAATLHALLGLTPADTAPLATPATDPRRLKADWAIVDECNVVDACLFDALLRALPDDAALVCVGDADQLPPVGPGAPFEALVATDDIIHVVRLDMSHRAATHLHANGWKCRVGQLPELDPWPHGQGPAYIADARDVPMPCIERARRSRASRDTRSAAALHADALASWLVQIVCDDLPARYPHLDPARDIQVITPQNGGPLGAIVLSGLIRERVNPRRSGERDGPGWYAGHEHRVRLGDAVIACESVSADIRNGRTGIVSALERRTRYVTITLDGVPEPVRVRANRMEIFALRYALTTHRAEGSEYPAVLMVIHPAIDRRVLTRRNVYTGLTRARELTIVLGTAATLRSALETVTDEPRGTTIPARLHGAHAPPSSTPLPVPA